MKTINYSMTPDYRKEWGVIEAVRELVQNCLDNKNCKSHYSYVNGMMTIRTDTYILPMSVFAMGNSTKSAEDIGGFGEGFKLALMILARLNLDPIVEFGNKRAYPVFLHDDLLGCDTFGIQIEDLETNLDGTAFYFSFPEDQMDLLKKRINVFADEQMDIPATVDVLYDRPGEIFVEGLFICEDDKFHYGYNFAADKIDLGCDRKVASTYGMAWETSQYWARNITDDKASKMLSMMTDDCIDVVYVHEYITEYEAKKITKAFNEKFGNVTIKPMGSSLGYGMSVGGSLYGTMKKSGYVNVTNKWAEKNTPFSKMEAFLASEKKHMRRHARVAFDKLMEDAKSWGK